MFKESPLFSIIIICESWNNFLEESLKYYDKLNYLNYEIFVFSTEKINKTYKNITFIDNPLLKNNPAERRDLAIKYARGEIYAFIDDDAFPHSDWLKNAALNFQDKTVVAVGGPGITPESADIMEKASGWVSASLLGGFGTTFRFIPQHKRQVDDFPSMNLLVLASDFKKIGGFDSAYYPGEDTKLCLDLTKKTNKKIIYDPSTVVYHHKRSLFKKHLIQNGRYGLHRGHFARNLPGNSRKLFYFIPSLFTIGIIIGVLLIMLSKVFPIYLFQILTRYFLSILSIYIFLLIFNALWVFVKSKSYIIAFLTIPGVFLTHFFYGLRFIQGFFSKRMHDTYGRSE